MTFSFIIFSALCHSLLLFIFLGQPWSSFTFIVWKRVSWTFCNTFLLYSMKERKSYRFLKTLVS